MRTKWIAGLAVLALVAGAAAQAAERFGRVRGTISAVDTLGMSLEITPARGPAVTLNLTPATKIEVVGEGAGSIVDLRVGLEASARFDLQTQNALNIEVADDPNEADAAGVVLSASFDSSNNTGSLALDTNSDPNQAELNLLLDGGSEVRLGGAGVALAEIGVLVGQTASVEYHSTSFLVYSIDVDPVTGLQVATGQVAAVDADARSLSINTDAGAMSLNVLSGASVRLQGRKSSLGDVRVGDQVEVSYLAITEGETTTHWALGIRVAVKPRHIVGALTAVGLETATLTIKNKRAEVVLTIDGGTRLRINGKQATLGAVAAALEAAKRAPRASAKYFVRGETNLAAFVNLNVKGGRGGKR